MISKLGPYELGPDGAGLYTGDSKELALDIPDESIDMIMCDPVYQNMEDYTWLAKTASRVLKPNRACLAFCSNTKHRETREVMDDYLKFALPLNYTVIAKTQALYMYHVFVWTTPCLYYMKGNRFPDPWIPDTYISTVRQLSNKHKWAKCVDVYRTWIHSFTHPGDIVWDPFTGGGTTLFASSQIDRKWLGFELDVESAREARKNISTFQHSFIPMVKNAKQERLI